MKDPGIMSTTADLAVIGGGIVGCVTARAVLARDPALKIILLEKEATLAAHQTGHNSGVIHAGLYYRPGSLKAATCTSGREALYAFCDEYKISHQRCGKVVVAVNESELPALEELERRGRANGLDGLERLSADQLQKHEPHARGIAGLFVPQTGIVDYVRVTQVMADHFQTGGGVIHMNTPVWQIGREPGGYRLQAGSGTILARGLVNCCGLHADRVARSAGLRPGLRIVPFRGEYYQFKQERGALVRHLIYPVPDPQMPFLGVHFTRMIDDTVEAGPNAVLAWKREGYRRSDISLRDLADTFSFGGFWKLAARFWRVGLNEYGRSFSKKLFVMSLQRLMPDIRQEDLVPGGSGVRAQAVDGDGRLVDDFRILTEGRMVHVLNAPSPAATASLSIGEHIADRIMEVIA
jgi:L-2-hydroxyglutarate oxidase